MEREELTKRAREEYGIRDVFYTNKTGHIRAILLN